MMARLGKRLTNLPGRSVKTEELEQRVEVIEAVVDSIAERVDDLERKDNARRAEQRERD